jgi:hypothetical protein
MSLSIDPTLQTTHRGPARYLPRQSLNTFSAFV